MSQIVVNLELFKKWFYPSFQDITQEQLDGAYAGASSFISTNLGEINLPENLQVRGVYLSTAHVLFLNMHPDVAVQGKVSNATEGSVSAGFIQPQYKNWLEYWLSLSPYGMELLAILAQIQPPLPRRPVNVNPYYKGSFGAQR